MSGKDWTFVIGSFLCAITFLGFFGLIIYAGTSVRERTHQFRMECVKQGGSIIEEHCLINKELKK